MICTGIGPCRLLLAVLVVSLACLGAAIQGPRSECYALDNRNYLYDFTEWIGKAFKYTDRDGSLYTLRFCKDVQAAAVDKSIVNFGRYLPAYSSSLPDTAVSFLQEYRSGDLKGCEKESNDYNGRGTQVAIMCGNCPTAPCEGIYVLQAFAYVIGSPMSINSCLDLQRRYCESF